MLMAVVGILPGGCKNWEYDVLKNDIHFAKIHQSNGGTYVGYMTENQLIQGFPCEKGWIHFTENWKLRSFQLSQDHAYNGTRLPAHTWLHFPFHQKQSGYVCAFPYDYLVQGFPCGGSGGFKGTQTGFYDSGKLRSFFPPSDIEINGVYCKSSFLSNVRLFENGALKSCTLAKAYQANGKTYKEGKTIEMD
jgi:hypothetical protein